MTPLGYVIYHGYSMLDSDVPIVVIMTLTSKNAKTGNMVQTWILRADMSPLDALTQNLDEPICGTCVHRLERTCYVNVARAPQQVYKAWLKGLYPTASPKELGHALWRRALRIGAYGDPAAVPISVWDTIAPMASSSTGYTHMWKDFPALSKYCMASVESVGERMRAKAMGFRTFRVKGVLQRRDKSEEARCPASREGSYKLTCEACGVCNGTRSGFNGDVAITIHGARMKRFDQERLF